MKIFLVFCGFFSLLTMVKLAHLGVEDDLKGIEENGSMDIDSDFEQLAMEEDEKEEDIEEFYDTSVSGKKRLSRPFEEMSGDNEDQEMKTQRPICSLFSHKLDALTYFFKEHPGQISFTCSSCGYHSDLETILLDLIVSPSIPEGVSFPSQSFELGMVQRLFDFAIKHPSPGPLQNMINLGIPFHRYPMRDDLSALAVGAIEANFKVFNVLTSRNLTFYPPMSDYDLLKYSLMGQMLSR